MINFFDLFSVDTLYIVLGLAGVSLITLILAIVALCRRAEGRRHGRYDRAEEPYGRLRLHQGQGMRFLQGLPRPAEGRQGDSVQGPDLHRRVQRRA